MRTFFLHRHYLPRVVQEKIADSAHVCIETKLCEKLGGATQDDYIRAELENYDFGQNSVMYKAFYENYPMLNTSAGLDKNDKATLQVCIDRLFKRRSIAYFIKNCPLFIDNFELVG